jgi:hypothetical protein
MWKIFRSDVVVGSILGATIGSIIQSIESRLEAKLKQKEVEIEETEMIRHNFKMEAIADAGL